ncbi:uncharacterized protein LOC124160130 [Ischnura elegans]|uniref:uncharacterized protein LOC124160130 n=1 Tax=Ischnura elegans TaxID=197161 RepID=UPI001ED89ECB|nr:uncharacterized protein LOC124160130 [Ischnura elegans]
MARGNMVAILVVLALALTVVEETDGASAKGGWSEKPTQYHIQTDEGPERFFRYQTFTGQYRKEKRLEDGTVVGTYGWVDPNGMLRLQDYVADNAGYRVVKSRKIFVGTKEAPAVPAPLPTTPAPPPVTTTRPPYRPPSSAPEYEGGVGPTTYRPPFVYSRPTDYDSDPQTDHRPPTTYVQRPSYQNDGYEQNSVYPEYDGVSTYHNGFRYFLPRHYHEEETSPTSRGDVRTGSFGYIDPFGIRRVVYYNTSPGTGFQHRKNNRYVGFNATPYDPRPTY